MPPTASAQSRFAKLFLTGLLTLLPLWLTWVVLRFVFVLMSDASRPWVEPLLHGIARASPQTLGWLTDEWVSFAVALLGTVGLILLVGVLGRLVVGQRMLGWFETFIARIPLASTIYGSARKLLDILQTSPDGTQRVVLIDFPSPEMKAVGFVTKVIREAGTGRELAAVYVPTTPNPTSGYLEIVPVDRITPTNWTVDEAMSFIISGGAVSRDEIPFERGPAQDDA
ncbi:DUF502 domain-containing protein [Luteimonas sp. e5]